MPSLPRDPDLLWPQREGRFLMQYKAIETLKERRLRRTDYFIRKAAANQRFGA